MICDNQYQISNSFSNGFQHQPLHRQQPHGCDCCNAPSAHDVVCARGRTYWDHHGNQTYRELIAGATQRYAQSTSKLEKSMIVTEIIEQIHDRNGMFIKKQRKGGDWIEVDEEQIREKVSQSLRDGLSGLYRSATQAKKQRRGKVNTMFHMDVERIIFSNTLVASMVKEMAHDVAEESSWDERSVSTDETISNMFVKANSNILETIKQDSSMLDGYTKALTSANIHSEMLCL